MKVLYFALLGYRYVTLYIKLRIFCKRKKSLTYQCKNLYSVCEVLGESSFSYQWENILSSAWIDVQYLIRIWQMIKKTYDSIVDKLINTTNTNGKNDILIIWSEINYKWITETGLHNFSSEFALFICIYS